MNIQNLRDLVAQINAAHPVENSDLPLLLEGKDGFLQITFMAHDIKVQLHHWWGFKEDWIAIALFHELSEIVWNLCEVHRDYDLVSISPSGGLLKVECKDTQNILGDDYMADTLEWLEDIHLQIACLVQNLYEFSIKCWRKPWDKSLWKAQELIETLELLFFDEDEFEAYYECGINGYDWYHLQAAALIARQNTSRKKAKYPSLGGINISAVNNNLEISAMCPTSTTYRLIWQEDPYWENFSFTIPVELIDLVTQSVDASAIDSIVFFVSPDLIRVKVSYRVADDVMHTLYFLVKPIQGRYWYPKVPVNQVTERSVAVKKELLHEALLGATKATIQPQNDEIILQVQNEKLYVHGLEGSFEICADCSGVQDNQIRLPCTQLLDMLKYVNSCTLFLDFPDKITQALMLGNASGVQYLIFGLIKGDYILSPEEDATQTLLTIPGIIPGEPDLELQLAESPILNCPLSEAERIYLQNELLQTYGLSEDWDFHASIDEMCDRFLEAQRILEDRSPSPAVNELATQLKQILDDHEYAIAAYEAGDPNGELYYHGGLQRKDLEVEIEAINEITNSVKILAGRIQEYSLKLEKTYSVRMTFA